MSYFDKFKAEERPLRMAVGEIFANYRLADEVSASDHKRVTTNGVTYAYGSPEPKPGEVRKPGTRRVGKGPSRKQRWALT